MKFKYRLQQVILFSGDCIGVALALFLSLVLRQLSWPNPAVIAAHIPLYLILMVVWALSNYSNGLYDLTRLSGPDRFRNIYHAAGLSGVGSVIAFYVIGNTAATPKTILVMTVIIGYIIAAAWRTIYTNVLSLTRLQTRIVLVGHDQETLELARTIAEHPEKSYAVAAIFDPTNKLKANDLPFKTEVYSNLTTLRAAITTHKIHVVVTAPSMANQPEIIRELYELLFWSVQITDFSDLYETVTGRVPASSYSDTWFITNLINRENPLYENFRRLVDYSMGVILGAIFIALTPLVALAIRLNSRGPIIFKQVRVGWRGEHFFLYKFRTMYALSADGSAEKNGAQFAQTNDERVTRVGRFLRQTRIDELPQFINLLRGDVTLIGPRPERPEVVEQIEKNLPYYHLRLLVKPGLTGWAAINQHYAGTLEEAIQKLQYDLYYIKNRSALLDIAILLRTVTVVVRMMGR